MSLPLRTVHPALKAMVPMVFIIVLMAITTAGSADNLNLEHLDPALITGLKISQLVGAIILFVAPALLFAHLLFEDGLRGLTLYKTPQMTLLFLSVLLILIAQPMISWISEMNMGMKLPASLSGIEDWMRRSEETLGKLTQAFLKDRSITGLISNLFIIAFVAAFGEELLFRGVIQKTLIHAFRNPHLAVWITAIIFSAVHMQFFGFFPRMFLGALLGYLYLWSGSIWVPILVHFINNGAAVVFTFISGNPDPEKLGKEAGFETTDPVWAIASIVLTIAIMILIAKRARIKPEAISTTI
jgi:uncharacterized protein